MTDWQAFFEPKTIALIGASRTPTKVGHIIWKKLDAYKGKVYPVNLKFEYKSVLDIKGEVDLAIIAVPAQFVPAVIAECAQKKVKAGIIISSGFAEVGDKGVKLEAPEFPVIGPNCFGVANPSEKLDTTFAKTDPPPGNIALVSQSGALASYLFTWAHKEGLGFSKFVSLGNRLSISETDCLEYLAQDTNSKVIGVYLESFQKPEAWLKIAGQVAKVKPVIVLLGGQTDSGAAASRSHTASLSPQPEVALTLLKQSGCLVAKDLNDFTNLLEVFALEPGLKDNDLAIITNAGGPAILAVDTAASLSLDVDKPIDVLGDALADRFQTAFDQVLKDKTRDAFLIIITPQANTEISATCEAIAKRFKKVNKPVIVSLLDGHLSAQAREILEANRIATIDLPQDAVTSLAGLLSFHRQKKLGVYPPKRSYKVEVKKLKTDQKKLSWLQATHLARAYQIPLVKTDVLEKPIRPMNFSWPLVLKADPAEAQHRTENKAIYLNIKTASALKTAYKQLRSKFATILVQEQLTSGHELFIGVSRETNFPPLLTIGMGGIYTELYRDVSRIFLPVNEGIIADTLKQTKIGRILYGFRTQNKLAVEHAVKLILNVCHLAEDYPELKNVEINPAIVTESSVTIVDFKIAKKI
jgi:acetyltransferase